MIAIESSTPQIGTSSNGAQRINAGLFLLLQIGVVFVYGFVLSTTSPNGGFNSEGSFLVQILPVPLFLFLGILGLVIAVRSIGKKNYSVGVFLLLIISLGLTVVTPGTYVSKKVAGFFNNEWTDQASQQREIEKQDHLRNNQIMQQQENLYYK